LVLRIQPGGEPLHFERQGDPVHRASDEMQTARADPNGLLGTTELGFSL
jgi:hypothetical protein